MRCFSKTMRFRKATVQSESKPEPTLTEVLRAAIERSGLTFYRIGRATGTQTAALSLFARGKKSFRLAKADQLAAYLGLRLVPNTNVEPQTTLTDVLRAAIQRSGLTVHRIAKATRTDNASLGRFVRGEVSIQLDKADRLAAYLELRLVLDPDAVPPEPTPEKLARPMLAKKTKQSV
jgi:transcriptional regulator with XRE-family HTH domain